MQYEATLYVRDDPDGDWYHADYRDFGLAADMAIVLAGVGDWINEYASVEHKIEITQTR